MATAATITATTASTMSTDGGGPRLWAAGLAGAAVGLCLVFLAVPRMAAQLTILPVASQVGAALSQGDAIDGPLLSEARRRYETAAGLDASDAELSLTLARLDFRAAKTYEDTAKGLNAAEAHLREAASQAPNDAFIWTELAKTALAEKAPAEKAINYLLLSWQTGRFELSSMIARPAVALAYWDELPEALREKTRQDIQRMWGRELGAYLRRLYLSLGYRERARFLEAGFPDEKERRVFLRSVLWNTNLRKELEKLRQR